MRAACNMSARSQMRRHLIYLDVRIKIVVCFSLFLDRPLCRLEGISELLVGVNTSFLYMSAGVHQIDTRDDIIGLTLGYVCPSRSCRRSQMAVQSGPGFWRQTQQRSESCPRRSPH